MSKIKNLQKILVMQQKGSGECKIAGIREFGLDMFSLKIVSIDIDLPFTIEKPEDYISSDLQADMVLDFLEHPDLSYEVAARCSQDRIPVVAKGKNWRFERVFTPPT